MRINPMLALEEGAVQSKITKMVDGGGGGRNV